MSLYADEGGFWTTLASSMMQMLVAAVTFAPTKLQQVVTELQKSSVQYKLFAGLHLVSHFQSSL